jgi:hypothetical protein
MNTEKTGVRAKVRPGQNVETLIFWRIDSQLDISGAWNAVEAPLK